MRRRRSFLVACGLTALGWVPAVGSPLRGSLIEQPLLVTAAVCALPASSCPRPDAVVRFVVAGAERRVGLTNLRVVRGAVTSGEIFAELRVRPVRLFGPEEELAKLEPGTSLRMRAVLRLGARYVFLESLEAIDGTTGR